MADDPRAGAQAVDPSPYGINAHVARDAILESLASIDVRWLRADVDWDRIETQQGVFDWRTVDRLLATARRLGLSVLASVSYTPAWASGSPDRATPPRDPTRFHEFVRTFVERHRSSIRAIGLWNEPNLRQFFSGSREQYLRDILLPGLQLVRRAAPELLTAGPDLSSSGDPIRDWLGPILLSSGSLLDVVTHHQYDGGDTLSGRVRAIEAVNDFLVAEGLSRPLWITEIGWDRVSEADQASRLRGVMEAMRARPWWSKTFWYDSHGPRWGMLEDDQSPRPGSPKPAYFAYRDVIAQGRAMPNFRHVITLAYNRILLRQPDSGGLENFNRAMNQGLTEAQLHEALLRSAEYAQRFPDAGTAARKRAQARATRKASGRRPPRRGRRG
jgi:hypothetical protein